MNTVFPSITRKHPIPSFTMSNSASVGGITSCHSDHHELSQYKRASSSLIVITVIPTIPRSSIFIERFGITYTSSPSFRSWIITSASIFLPSIAKRAIPNKSPRSLVISVILLYFITEKMKKYASRNYGRISFLRCQIFSASSCLCLFVRHSCQLRQGSGIKSVGHIVAHSKAIIQRLIRTESEKVMICTC